MRRAFFLSIGIGVVACSLNVSGTLPFEPPAPPPDGGIPDASLPPGSDGAIPEDAGGDVFGAPFPPSNVDGGLVLDGGATLDAVLAIDTSTLTINIGGIAFVPGTYPAGVSFTVEGGYAVLSAGTITLGPADVAISGTLPLVVLASTDLVVSGNVLAGANGIFPGPGGFGPSAGPGAGADGTRDNTNDTGGGGAGHGTPGATGTKTQGNGAMNADGGVAYDLPLSGGSGGGAGPSDVVPITCGKGGAGGGAVQLYAGRELRITAQGIVQVGGAGGFAGCLAGAGGGGGSGGTVWLEAPEVDIAGVVAANGGGGGGATRNNLGSELGGSGENARASGTRADGGVGVKTGGMGEALGGGAGGALEGPPLPSVKDAKENSGGGGGAAGRVRVRALMFIVDGGVISPAHEVR